jgi:hypothetical protein
MYLDFVCNDLIGVVYFLVGDFLYDPLATLSGLTEKLWAAQLKKKKTLSVLCEQILAFLWVAMQADALNIILNIRGARLFTKALHRSHFGI